MTELQTKRVKIVVNGEERFVPGDQNVRSVLAALGIEADRVAVELDRAIVRKTDWESTAVPDGSRLEIVQFVGGG
jgi:sulfur carrier protein